ncbi:MAG TPA: hypothetical protein VF743_03990 [Acidimicrobiales bacterium]
MSATVRWAAHVTAAAAGLGPEGEHDFVTGPLAAATVRFRDVDSLPEEAGPAVRSVHVVDPGFGVLVFVAVVVDRGVVEIADFAVDPDYWELAA